MQDSPLRDLWVGIFVLAGLGAIAYLSVQIGGVSYRGPGGLQLYATFDEIGSLKHRAQVVVGGVKVGQVKSIALDTDFRARVLFEVDGDLELPIDTSASVLTAGVLGDQYIALEPGGEEDILAPGDEIEYTQSAVVLERLIGKVLNSLGDGGDD
ncbi:MAG: outer membrane lipid asymmetry maintenance protein MlaD [Myxococcota bacterium]|nr:outer membrane lipid asymmetry maintenance protein MlaD [Myxococcota bacterium]